MHTEITYNSCYTADLDSGLGWGMKACVFHRHLGSIDAVELNTTLRWARNKKTGWSYSSSKKKNQIPNFVVLTQSSHKILCSHSLAFVVFTLWPAKGVLNGCWPRSWNLGHGDKKEGYGTWVSLSEDTLPNLLWYSTKRHQSSHTQHLRFSSKHE